MTPAEFHLTTGGTTGCGRRLAGSGPGGSTDLSPLQAGWVEGLRVREGSKREWQGALRFLYWPCELGGWGDEVRFRKRVTGEGSRIGIRMRPGLDIITLAMILTYGMRCQDGTSHTVNSKLFYRMILFTGHFNVPHAHLTKHI